MIRFVLLALLGALTVALQTSFIATLGFAHLIFLPVCLLVLATLFLGGRHIGWLGLICGFAIDLFSPVSFGIHLVLLTATGLLVEILYLNFFTNRSFYAMIVLVLTATSFHAIFWVFLAWLLKTLQGARYEATWASLNPLLLAGNILMSVLFFYILLGLQSLVGRYFIARRRLRTLS